jgi:hypothetical protein
MPQPSLHLHVTRCLACCCRPSMQARSRRPGGCCRPAARADQATRTTLQRDASAAQVWECAMPVSLPGSRPLVYLEKSMSLLWCCPAGNSPAHSPQADADEALLDTAGLTLQLLAALLLEPSAARPPVGGLDDVLAADTAAAILQVGGAGRVRAASPPALLCPCAAACKHLCYVLSAHCWHPVPVDVQHTCLTYTPERHRCYLGRAGLRCRAGNNRMRRLC